MRRPFVVLAAVLAALGLTLVAALALPGGGNAGELVAAPATSTSTSTTAKPVSHFIGATAVVDEVELYELPDAGSGFLGLPNPTFEHVPLTFQVLQVRPDGWLYVKYNKRPNGAKAWIRAEDVQQLPVPNRIVIGLEAKQLTVYEGDSDRVVFQAPVAVGKESSPTPLGDFYVDVHVKIRNTSGPYGAYQLSVAGFSEVYQSFGGGIGQIAIHGTNQPNLIGNDVSNGCVRMSNEDIIALAELVPNGTPVLITA